MGTRSIELLNDLLKIFSQEGGEYLKLVGDKDRVTTIPSGEIKIADVNTGAISNPLEYLRLLGRFFVDQMDLTKAVDTWLRYLGKDIYGINRPVGASEADYRSLVQVRVLGDKCSPLMILEAIFSYSTTPPVMIEGLGGAFCDVSFCDCYRDFDPVGGPVVRAAMLGASAYFFRLLMTGVDPTKYKEIIDIVNNYKADGISYDIMVS